MIESRNLFKLQSKLTKNNKTIPVKAIEKNYVLSWILIGIAKSKIRDVVTFKGMTAFDIIGMLDSKKTNYKRLWETRLDKHMLGLPYFDKVYRELRRSLRPLNKTLK